MYKVIQFWKSKERKGKFGYLYTAEEGMLY